MNIILRLLILLIAIFSAMPVAAGDGEVDGKVRKLIVSDAANKLSGGEMDYHSGIYSELRNRGFSDSEIREYMRPILEQHGFSEKDIVRYFNLFDVNYHGGEGRRLEDQKRIVESLIN
ncbi:MAG: hypothetical protein RBR41_02450 [Desulfovibrio sp.]|uniref:hypothetical protein n=1 Tax=Desulfovibrio sp. TaxID=885 RepID=UPI002A364E56|nr:hypothetical protein [Desulfovibrio sp.]MDY0258512.1 hypothetical protein [Desulfovibrio sp.]